MTDKIPNHLIDQQSPYLLQHAYNPVDWYPWGAASLEKAQKENKLLVISIGYAACHWCHVMEQESFEDNIVAKSMNSRYVSVKVDREERPDVDHVYMNACQAMTGRGGWPLNVIALPDQRPLFAGTYFSKQDWLYILDYFADVKRLHPEELEKLAREAENGLRRAIYIPPVGVELQRDGKLLEAIFGTWEDDLDYTFGGTRGAPKFPMPANLSALLSFAILNNNKTAEDYIKLSLERIAMGGIYDQIGGGFSRYSVDAKWNVPHFEKMLYDNAQLVSIYARAYQHYKYEPFRQVIFETLEFIERELTSPGGLYYTSIDADSEGQEGKFYVWSQEELLKQLAPEILLFSEYFSCESTGNWEPGVNVLRMSKGNKAFAEKHALTEEVLTNLISSWKSRLLKARLGRIRPTTDDKILTSWNGMMISGLADAYKALGDPVILDRALSVAGYYREKLHTSDGILWRNLKNDTTNIPGFLDDYSFLIKAFLDLYQVTFDIGWIDSATLLTGQVVTRFNTPDDLFFQLASLREKPLIHQTIELGDNVIPSSNSQMACNLYILGHLTGKQEYISRSEKMLSAMIPLLKRNPGFHANWFSLLELITAGPIEISIIGPECRQILQHFSGFFHPAIIWSGSIDGNGLPQFLNQYVVGDTLIYICRNKTCYPPVKTVREAMALISQ